MANVTVLRWRDSANAFLEPEKELKELLSAWALRNTGKWDLHPFSEYLTERLEPVAEVIAREFAKAHVSVEVVVLWFVMRHSSRPHLTLDFCVRESSSCYQIFRRDVMLSREDSDSEARERVNAWIARLTREFTKEDVALRTAIRELGCAFSRRRTLPEEVRAAASLLAGRRKAG